jgi:hypothetical protein
MEQKEFKEWSSVYIRIPGSTTYTISFPVRLYIHEIVWQGEGTGASAQPFNVVFNTGHGNSLPWVTSAYAPFNYNAYRFPVVGPNQFKFPVKYNAYGVTLVTGTTACNIIICFEYNPVPQNDGTEKFVRSTNRRHNR